MIPVVWLSSTCWSLDFRRVWRLVSKAAGCRLNVPVEPLSCCWSCTEQTEKDSDRQILHLHQFYSVFPLFETDSPVHQVVFLELRFGSAHRLIDLMVLQLHLIHLHRPAETHLSFIQTHRTLFKILVYEEQKTEKWKWCRRNIEYFYLMEWHTHRKQTLLSTYTLSPYNHRNVTKVVKKLKVNPHIHISIH